MKLLARPSGTLTLLTFFATRLSKKSIRDRRPPPRAAPLFRWLWFTTARYRRSCPPQRRRATAS